MALVDCQPFLFIISDMPVMSKNTFCKAERLSSKIRIGKLFAGGAKSFSVFPLRLVYMEMDDCQDVPVSILISVPKKRFKRAVHRNRVKRQIREAYRKNKHDLWQLLEQKEKRYIASFIYLSDEMVPSVELEDKMKILLARMSEKVL